MRKKLSSETGFSLVELLAATIILMLLALMLNTGLQMMFDTYQTMIAKSEVELLLSTAVDALADDLRYARDVSKTVDKSEVNGISTYTNFTYTSDSFGAGIGLKLDGEGRIRANNMRVLSTGAYGSGAVMSYKEYKVTNLSVTFDDSSGEGIFNIYLKVATEDESIFAETPDGGVQVRCLNPPKKTTP